jgi:hypothetical protein
MLVLPVLRGVGGAFAVLALLKAIQLGSGLVVRHIRRRRRAAAALLGPYRPARPRINPTNVPVAEISQ